MVLLEMGLTMHDINNIDVNFLKVLAKKYIDRKKRNRLLKKYETAEAFYMAYVGGQPGQKGRSNVNFHRFQNWQRKLLNEINKGTEQNGMTLKDKIKMARKGKKRKVIKI